MGGWFYKLGRLAGPKLRKSQWIWQSLTGSEADILRAEEQVGRDLASAMSRAMGVEEKTAAAEQVQRIGRSLHRCVADRQRRFTFTVAREGEANAFALPGGYVFITRALIELIGGRDDELACILGHEIAHVIKQDPMQRMMTDATIGAAVRAAPLAGPAGRWLGSAGAQMLQSAYSQDRELFADRLGARLAQAAGFEPPAAVRMLGRLAEAHGEHPEWPLAVYFASHPPFDVRIAELRGYLATLGVK